ncbi:16493_t:CDS:2, partial [Acaulospora colombiana]
DETEAVEGKRYTALSYSYEDAEAIFQEWYPDIPRDAKPERNQYCPHVLEIMKKDPMMTAWNQVSSDPKKQEEWNRIALRQRNAGAFLDCYLDTRYRQWLEEGAEDGVEYIWLDEFCLYDPENPSLETRNEELGRMADIFRFAEAVCVYCPIINCKHVSKRPNRDCQYCGANGRLCQRCNKNGCHWGSRLWTLSEIVHANKVVSMTRVQGQHSDPFYNNWEYSLTKMDGRDFRAQMQRQAELDGQWHLHAIMRHANNSGSSTWQQAIHSLVVEAILRNQAGRFNNKYLAKALNGLLPRRAMPKHLLGKDGWADLAWLLELNQGFYNAAGLAAVCGLGETTTQGKGWLGPPLAPAPGNERIEPVVIAFPIPSGLFITNPRIVGLNNDIERDIGGMYRTKKLLPFQSPSQIQSTWSSIFLKKSGFVLLRNERWDDKKGYTAQEYLGERDSRLERLESWGYNQLAPEWAYDFSNWTKSERDSMKRSTLVDLNLGIMADCYIRDWEDKPPNALIPLAVHGCGVTCLILHHHDDRTKAAVKLGIVNLAPYLLNQGVALAALEATKSPRSLLSSSKLGPPSRVF